MRGFMRNKNEFFDKRQKVILTITFLLIFLYNAAVAVHEHYPHIMQDEIGVAASAAFFAGQNWSSYMRHSSYYGWGQALLYVPVYLATNNPVLRGIFTGLINSFIVSLIFLVTYTILNRHLALSKSRSYCYAAFAALLPSYTAITKWMWNETMMAFVPWLVLLVLLEANQNIRLKKLMSGLLAFLCVYSYAVHGRGLAVTATVILILIGTRLFAKKWLVSLPVFAASFCLSYLAYYGINRLLLSELYLLQEGAALANTAGSSFPKLLRLFTAEGIRSIALNLIGGVYTATCATFGLMSAFVVYCLYQIKKHCAKQALLYLKKNKEEKRKLWESLCEDGGQKQNWLLLVVYAALFFAIAFSISMITLHGNRGDYLIYDRYYANALGIIATCALILLMERKAQKRLYPWIAALTALGLLCGAPIASKCGYDRPYMFANLYPFLRVGSGHEIMRLTLSVAVIAAAILLLQYYKKTKICLALLMLVSVYSYAYSAKYATLVRYAGVVREVDAPQKAIHSYPNLESRFPDVAVVLPDMHIVGVHITGRYQYSLPEYHVSPYTSSLSNMTLSDNVLVVANAAMPLNLLFENCYRLSDSHLEGSRMGVWAHGDEIKAFMEEEYGAVFYDYASVPLRTFYTQIGRRTDTGLEASGKEGYLLYGPYVTLPAGSYALTIEGTVKEQSDKGAGSFDIVSQLGKQSIMPATPLESFVADGRLNVAASFDLPDMTDNVEFRLFANDGTIMEVERVTLTKADALDGEMLP